MRATITREHLLKRRAIVIADAQMKFDVADWHGVADAMMDLREIDAQITLMDVLRDDRTAARLDALAATGDRS